MWSRKEIILPQPFLTAIEDAELSYSQNTNISEALTTLQSQLETYVASLNGDDYADSEKVQKTLSRARLALINLQQRIENREVLSASPLSQLINNLNDEETNQLAETLMDGPSFPRSPKFQALSQSYTCRDLAGNNSTNILLIPKTPDGVAEVVRFERRDNIPLNETLQAAQLSPIVIAPAALRLVLNSSDEKGNKVRYLEVVPFFNQDNAFKYVRRPLNPPFPNNRLFQLRHFNIAQQICDGFQDLEKNNIFFSDGKPQNWFIDNQGRVKIQGPSLLTGLAPTELYSGKKNRFPASHGFCHDEIYSCEPQATPSQSHSALFGRCLYSMLTGQSLPDNNNEGNIEELIKRALVSNAQVLGPYDSLIHNLVSPVPSERITLSEAQEQLKHIGQQNGLLPSSEDEMRQLASPEALPPLSRISPASIESLDSPPPISPTSFFFNEPYGTTDEELFEPLDERLMEQRNELLGELLKVLSHDDNSSLSLSVGVAGVNSIFSEANSQMLRQQIDCLNRFLLALRTCQRQGFGNQDSAMNSFLGNKASQFVEHLNTPYQANDDIEALIHFTQNLARENGTNQAIHHAIERLRGKTKGGAEKIQTILRAAGKIPVELRAALNAHQNDSRVQSLLRTMDESRSTGCCVSSRHTTTYRRFLQALQNPNPQNPMIEETPPTIEIHKKH